MVTTGSVRIALLEDEQTLREALSGQLIQAGHEVVVQGGATRPFIDGVRATLPDIAIVDLRIIHPETLNEDDGLSVVRELRALRTQLRILVLSALRLEGTLERCLAEGADGYLWKLTAGREVILKAVSTLMRGERFIPAENFELGQSPPRARPDRLSELTPRELEVLGHIGEGEDNLKIAACLGITERTVKAHVTSLYRRLGLENRAQMALLAFQLGVARPRRA